MANKRIFTEEQFEDILSMYYNDEPVKKIYKKYGTGYEGLYKLLNEKGIKKREVIKKKYDFLCNEKIFEDNGYHVVSEKPKNGNEFINLSDNDGYLYTLKYCNAITSLSADSSFLKFSKYNSNSIYNISLWLKNNKPHLSVQSTDFINTKTKIEFLCSNCNNKFFAVLPSIMSEIENKSCPFCTGHKVSDMNRLIIKRPDLIDYWDSIKNACINLEDISFSSKIKYWWKCNNNHGWQSSPNDLCGNVTVCPYCSGFYVTDNNRFVLCFPEIAKQAKSELNKDIDIYKLANYSGVKLFWECEFGHIWEASVSNRVRKKQGCPYCSGHRVTNRNRLCLNFPEIYLEIDFEKNEGMDYYELGYGTPKKIWWKCNNCHESYFASVCNRTGLNRGCPNCDMSQGELKVKSYLIKNFIKYISEFSFDNCRYKRVLPFDFYLEEYNICIEYQGKQHYTPLKYFGGEETFNIQKIKDKIKYDYCENNNIPLIIIPYWEYNNIEAILLKELSL
jgi:hypothetical protein